MVESVKVKKQIIRDSVLVPSHSHINNEYVQPHSILISRCCQTCRNMTGTLEGLRDLLSNEGYEHHNWAEMENASKSGCRMCSWWEINELWCGYTSGSQNFFFNHQDRLRFKAVTRPSDITTAFPVHPLSGLYLDAVRPFLPDPSGRRLHPLKAFWDINFRLQVNTCIDTSTTSFISKRLPSKNLDSPVVVTGVRRWLEDCQHHHKNCPGHAIPELPKRILEVGIDESSLVRLHSSTRGETGQYAALSYCWGGPQPIYTTLNNLQSHEKGLIEDALPRTIRDAIKTTRLMGIWYLWVDALCIIQDDPSDKITEISKMGDIYKSSTITIVAASAGSVMEGFLCNPKLEHSPPAIHPFYIDEGTSGYVGFVHPDGHLNLHQHDPLFQRGWSLQEMLLSPRKLIFDAHELTVTCQTDLSHSIVPNYTQRLDLCPSLPYTIFQDESICPAEYKDDRSLWAGIIYYYSSQDLSLFCDRLPAVAGIAQELSKMWDDTYLAGLWKSCIVEQLAWYKAANHRVLCENFKYLDKGHKIGWPTWSWATVPRQVCFASFGSIPRPDAKLIDYHIEPMSQALPFGEVRHGTLILEGLIIEARRIKAFPSFKPRAEVQVPKQPSSVSNSFSRIWRSTLSQQPPLQSSCSNDYKNDRQFMLGSFDMGGQSGTWSLGMDLTELPSEDDDVRLLFLGKKDMGRWWSENHNVYIFLILQTLSDGTYVRLGRANMLGDKESAKQDRTMERVKALGARQTIHLV